MTTTDQFVFFFEIYDECDFCAVSDRFVSLSRSRGEHLAMDKCDARNAIDEYKGWTWRVLRVPLIETFAD